MKTNLPLHWHFKCPHRQEGAVLVISIMLLVILTMLGISAIESTKLETRMAKNTQTYNEAFQTAEAGLVQAGNQLIDRISSGGGKKADKPDAAADKPDAENAKVFVIPECQFVEVPDLEIKIEGNEGEVAELVGIAELDIMGLTPKPPYKTLFFVAKSNGYNGEQEDKNVIHVTLRAGMKRDVPPSDNLITNIGGEEKTIVCDE